MTPTAIADAVAAFGLPSSPRLPASLGADAWDELVETSTRERIVPALAAAVASGALLDVDANDARRQVTAGAHERSMRTCLLLERTLLQTAAELERHGIPFRVLKGPAVAHLDYADPSQRAFGDVDLLVPSKHFDASLRVLAAAGGTRRYREVSPGFDRRFGKGACVVLPDRTEIDVHRTFVAGPFGLTVDLDALFATSSTVTIGGRDLPALDREHRFLHACFHAALGDPMPRLSALRDVAQMVLLSPLDANEALHRAREWRALAVVARAVTLSWARLGLASVPLSCWAAAHRADPFETRSLRAYTGAGRSYATQTAAGLRALPGVPAKLAYLRAVVVADRHHVDHHDGSYARRLRRGWQALRSTRAPS